MHERFAAGPAPHGDRLADEERVVAHFTLEREPALDPAERAVDQRCAELPGRRLDPRPVRDRGYAASEVLGQVLLARGEDADRERARLAEQFVQGGMPAESDAEEGRLEERETNESTVRPAASSASSTVTTATGAGISRRRARRSGSVTTRS